MRSEFGDAPEDHPVTCGLCPQRMPAVLIDDHLELLHGVDRDDPGTAPVRDKTEEGEQ